MFEIWQVPSPLYKFKLYETSISIINIINILINILIINLLIIYQYNHHCVKSVRIRNISPYSVQMRENADQNNPKYGHFSRSVLSYMYQNCTSVF